ncbi:MAG: ABC transporter ATP-binding protein, partial [Pseudomonadota bacterium]
MKAGLNGGMAGGPPPMVPQEKGLKALGKLWGWTLAATSGMRGKLILASLGIAAGTLMGQVTIQAISSIIRILQGGSDGAANPSWDPVTRTIFGVSGGSEGALMVLFGVLVVAGILINFFSRTYSAAVDYEMVHGMRGRIHRVMLDPGLNRATLDKSGVGDRVSVIERQVQGAQPMLREIFCLPITRLIPLVTAIILLFLNLPDTGGGQWGIYLIILVGLVASPLVGIKLAEILRAGTADLEVARNKFTGETITSVTDPDVLIGLGAVGARQRAFEGASQGVVDASMIMRVRQEISSQFQNAIVPVVQFALIAYAVLAPGDTSANIGAIFAIYLLVPQVIAPVQEVVRFVSGAYQALPMMQKPAEHLVEETVPLEEGATLAKAADRPAKVSVVDLAIGGTRGSEIDRPILHVQGCDIQGPGAVAVIGPSGAGKSTFLKAIARLNDFDNGEILLNATDVNAASELSLREFAGMAEQFPFLVDGSVRDNLVLADPDAQDQHLLDVISRYNGARWLGKVAGAELGGPAEGMLARTVQENGQALFSGGERRILSIIRAALRDPAILLLDEPSTGLDTASVTALSDIVNQVKQDRLVLFVDHNLGFVEDVADRIIYLVRGPVAIKVDAAAHEINDPVGNNIDKAKIVFDKQDNPVLLDLIDDVDERSDAGRIKT